MFLEKRLDESRIALWGCILALLLDPINKKETLAAMLFLITIIFVIIFLSLIYSRKECPSNSYNFDYVTTCLLAIFSITITFGNYYFHQHMLGIDDFIIIEHKEKALFAEYIYSLYDNILFYFCIFKYSLQFYFDYSSDPVQQAQYIYGLVLTGTLITTLYTRINHTIDK